MGEERDDLAERPIPNVFCLYETCHQCYTIQPIRLTSYGIYYHFCECFGFFVYWNPLLAQLPQSNNLLVSCGKACRRFQMLRDLIRSRQMATLAPTSNHVSCCREWTTPPPRDRVSTFTCMIVHSGRSVFAGNKSAMGWSAWSVQLQPESRVPPVNAELLQFAVGRQPCHLQA